MGITCTFSQLDSVIQDSSNKISGKTVDMMRLVGMHVDREVQATWNKMGPQGTNDQRAYNRTNWQGYSLKTLHPYKHGRPIYDKWRKRYTTDTYPERRWTGRYYDAASKMNQASGTFRKSWRIMELDSKHMKYGTDYLPEPIAKHLIKNRPVINYDETMQRQFKTLVSKWYGDNFLK